YESITPELQPDTAVIHSQPELVTWVALSTTQIYDEYEAQEDLLAKIGPFDPSSWYESISGKTIYVAFYDPSLAIKAKNYSSPYLSPKIEASEDLTYGAPPSDV